MDPMLDEVEEFLTGARPTPMTNRVLATVLFTDIVGSTDRLPALGDAAWAPLLERHDTTVRRELGRFGGSRRDTTGDGFLALFDGPARAIRCGTRDPRGTAQHRARRPRRRAHRRGRAGRRRAARNRSAPRCPARRPRARERLLVIATTHDLVEGSGLEFEDRGEHELKGIEGAAPAVRGSVSATRAS